MALKFLFMMSPKKFYNWSFLAKISALTSNVLKLIDMTNWRVYATLR